LGDGVAMASDESGLAATDVGDQGAGEPKVGLLPEIVDFARVTVVTQGGTSYAQYAFKRMLNTMPLDPAVKFEGTSGSLG
jgi:hypothetical protein